MAQDFNVSGPTTLKWDIASEGVFTTIGRTQDDDPPAFDVQQFNRILRANDTGDAPAEIVFTGKMILITATLVKWDEAEYVKMIKLPTGTDEGEDSTIGTRWVADRDDQVGCFQLQIVPTRSGEKIYTFPTCYIDGPGSIRMMQFGNMEKALAVQISAISDGTDHYTVTTV